VTRSSNDARIDGVCIDDDDDDDEGGVCVGGDAPVGSWAASIDDGVVGRRTKRFRSASAKELDDARTMHRASDGGG
jgi:hypothetical protein